MTKKAELDGKNRKKTLERSEITWQWHKLYCFVMDLDRTEGKGIY